MSKLIEGDSITTRNESMRRNLLCIGLLFLFLCATAWGQDELLGQNEKPYAVIQDMQGKRLEGYLSLYPKEITVISKEKKEKPVPLKAVESITFEKVDPGVPGADRRGEAQYSVRLKNSNEVYTLKNKYSLSLNTELGVIIKEIDAETVQSYLRKDPSSPPGASTPGSLLKEKSFVFSLELKF
jgi:hypothetical protein